MFSLGCTPTQIAPTEECAATDEDKLADDGVQSSRVVQTGEAKEIGICSKSSRRPSGQGDVGAPLSEAIDDCRRALSNWKALEEERPRISVINSSDSRCRRHMQHNTSYSIRKQSSSDQTERLPRLTDSCSQVSAFRTGN
ncbi:unnamed protein product [Nippostrongylus brasiliensis]|uniref:Uncharacterized protein n=1 Tax=Nippostrongylus brasiliensis TaxID=27835 RepID=A0A0N4XH16_NIPBR|nr:unnamed protein product [Nippostrongylus brasiliensis]